MGALRTARRFVARLQECRREELWFAARAFCVAPAVELGLATLGLKRVLHLLDRVPARAQPDARAVTVEEGARLVDNVYRVHLVRGACLPRALVQHVLHRRDGVPARFVVGVRRDGDADHGVGAHAWVEEAPPASSQRTRRFAPILVTEPRA